MLDPVGEPNHTWVAISAGYVQSLALDSDGHIYSWGNNQYGELGDGTNTDKHSPVRVVDPARQPNTTWASIEAGDMHSLAIDTNGHAWAWGRNDLGHLGEASGTNQNTPVRVFDPFGHYNTTWISLNANNSHNLAIDSTHHLYSWGNNANYQLGDGTTTTRSWPVSVQTPAGKPNITWAAASPGGAYSIALDTDGHAYGWGYNGFGQLGNNTTTNGTTPARVLDPAGKPNITWKTISSGGHHVVALDNDGHAYAWGNNDSGQLGDGTTTDRHIPVPVIMPRYTITDVNVGGTTISASDRTINPTTGVWDITMPNHVPATVDVAVTYRLDGIDGSGNFITGNQTGIVTLHYTYSATNAVKFSLGDAAGKTTSPVPADQWVYSDDAQPIYQPDTNPTWSGHRFVGWFQADGSHWDFTTPVTASMTLKAGWDGTPTFTMEPHNGPVSGGTPVRVTVNPSSSGLRFTQVAAGSDFTLALGTDGHVYAWGANNTGQLGQNDTAARTGPVEVRLPADKVFTTVAAGSQQGFAVSAQGQVYAWGANSGQLGDGTATDRATPVVFVLPTGVKAVSVAAGSNHSLVLADNGHIYTAGLNSDGQLGLGDTTTRTTPADLAPPVNHSYKAVAAGASHSLALLDDGSIRAWGNNANGQLGNNTITGSTAPVETTLPAGTTAAQVTAGGDTSGLIDSTGRAWTWGNNANGQLGLGDTANRTVPTVVSGLPSTVSRISMGGTHSLAVSSNNLYAWGNNTYGQLGTGDTTARTAPTTITLPGNATPAWPRAGSTHSISSTTDGAAHTWGDNRSRQLGDPAAGSQRSRPKKIAIADPTVTKLQFDTPSYTVATSYDSSTGTWTASTPAHPEGQVPVTLTWTIAGRPQPNASIDGGFNYYIHLTLPKAGVIPLQQWSGGGLLVASALAALTYGGHAIAKRKTHPGRHSQHSPSAASK
ncbi:hypothetical protein KIM372_14890 [Bombiscardovia nodaiensis]|uniref:RCC1-like domain-containing protein n=1 Tax=Bombiscardovia nodaiensis TaxID=2932181 RepID=A0ABN6SEH7_9BIFI|nr:hypothetical protein KIM372_14890 [Bombiscardovia nodaiensis]